MSSFYKEVTLIELPGPVQLPQAPAVLFPENWLFCIAKSPCRKPFPLFTTRRTFPLIITVRVVPCWEASTAMTPLVPFKVPFTLKLKLPLEGPMIGWPFQVMFVPRGSMFRMLLASEGWFMPWRFVERRAVSFDSSPLTVYTKRPRFPISLTARRVITSGPLPVQFAAPKGQNCAWTSIL